MSEDPYFTLEMSVSLSNVRDGDRFGLHDLAPRRQDDRGLRGREEREPSVRGEILVMLLEHPANADHHQWSLGSLEDLQPIRDLEAHDDPGRLECVDSCRMRGRRLCCHWGVTLGDRDRGLVRQAQEGTSRTTKRNLSRAHVGAGKLLLAPLGQSLTLDVPKRRLLLGKVIEAASGKDYFEYVRERIFKPAEMTSTDSYELDLVTKNLAVGDEREETAAGPRFATTSFPSTASDSASARMAGSLDTPAGFPVSPRSSTFISSTATP